MGRRRLLLLLVAGLALGELIGAELAAPAAAATPPRISARPAIDAGVTASSSSSAP